MKIRLFCVAGMSTSLLVNRMKEAAAGRGEDLISELTRSRIWRSVWMAWMWLF